MKTELETQQAFRSILQAMANPGIIRRLGNDGSIAASASLELLAETLLDQDVTFCVLGDESASELENRIYELTKSPKTELSHADFIFVTGRENNNRLLAANRGLPEYPDWGATIVFSVESLAEGSRDQYTVCLSGPGIPDARYVRIRGLDPEALRHLKELNSRYPLGVDGIFADNKDCIVCIPRSSKISVR